MLGVYYIYVIKAHGLRVVEMSHFLSLSETKNENSETGSAFSWNDDGQCLVFFASIKGLYNKYGKQVIPTFGK